MGEHFFCNPGELAGLLESHLGKKRRDIASAIEAAAEESIAPIRKRTPKAFGELEESAHAIPGPNPKIVLDAPHAGAVEVGSAPHVPNIDKLVAWVRLRGMQAIHKRSQLARLGPTTPEQAIRVGEMLSARVVRANALGRGLGRGRVSPVDAPMQVALAIAKGIEANGTRPHWMVRSSLPDIRQILSRRIRGALNK